VSAPADDTMTVDARRAVFQALLEAQDAGASVADSRADVAARFAVTVAQVKEIEREGIERQWPPL
jgi:hypothetical protein